MRPQQLKTNNFILLISISGQSYMALLVAMRVRKNLGTKKGD